MKLRNKVTGEITECVVIPIDESGYPNEYQTFEKGESLEQLNENWEDYEETKDIYFIDRDGNVVKSELVDDKIITLEKQAIGNFFTTKAEAEKAVEKLKAWKRLKDARFKFKDFSYRLDEESSNTISADGNIGFELICYEDFTDDLNLLFGDEK